MKKKNRNASRSRSRLGGGMDQIVNGLFVCFFDVSHAGVVLDSIRLDNLCAGI